VYTATGIWIWICFDIAPFGLSLAFQHAKLSRSQHLFPSAT
jgi:hypothetical protein